MLLLLLVVAPALLGLAWAASVYNSLVRDDRRAEQALGTLDTLVAWRDTVSDDIERAGVEGRIAVARRHHHDLASAYVRRRTSVQGAAVAHVLRFDAPAPAAP